MDDHIVFARTEQGRNELLGNRSALKPRPRQVLPHKFHRRSPPAAKPTLKPRPRQVLFLINAPISVGELRAKLPSCQELDSILEHLWESGYVGQVKRSTTDMGIGDALSVLGHSRLQAARKHALRVVASLAGEHSPAYTKLETAEDQETFMQALALSKKMLATTASAHQAALFEREVLAILHLPASNPSPLAHPSPHATRTNSIDEAKAHALGAFKALVGDRSPVYMKLYTAHNRVDFAQAVAAGKKVIAAVASSVQAESFEREVMERL